MASDARNQSPRTSSRGDTCHDVITDHCPFWGWCPFFFKSWTRPDACGYGESVDVHASRFSAVLVQENSCPSHVRPDTPPTARHGDEPKSQNTVTTITTQRTRDKGDTRDRWQHEDDLGSSIFPPSRFPAACQRSDPSERTQLCLLAPFFHQEVRNRDHVRCPINSGRSTAAKTPPAHKPPASMSWSAGRLQHEPFDGRSAWKFPPAG